jgi:penicillin-binding protein 1A
MTKIMQKTVEEGTLANGAGWGSKFTYRDANGKAFRMPAAGKTGTPQNWSDAWAVGYTPYYTTAIWFGFAKPGNSLGVDPTGASVAGPVWGDFMREVHQGLPYKDFTRPSGGTIDMTVCTKSGKIRTDACNEGVVTLPFLEGGHPTQYCDIHGNASIASTPINQIRTGVMTPGENDLLRGLSLPSLPADLFPELFEPARNSQNSNRNQQQQNRNTRGNASPQGRQQNLALPFNDSNPFLDGSISEPARQNPPFGAGIFESENFDAEVFYPYSPESGVTEARDNFDQGLELPSYNPLFD